MCLAVPLKILKLHGNGKAAAAHGSGEIEIDVSLLEKPEVGDHVIVHAGYAIETLSLSEAEERLELFKKMARLADGDAR